MSNKANSRSRRRRGPPDIIMDPMEAWELILSNHLVPVDDSDDGDDDDDDETVQFAADPFLFEQFRIPPRRKRNKSSFHGLGRAIARQEQAAMPTCSTASKENNKRNRRGSGTLEESQRRILEGLRTSKAKESKTEVRDPAEIKAREFDSLLKYGFEAYSLGQYGLAAIKYKLALEMLADSAVKSRTEHVKEYVLCYMLCISFLETNQLSSLSEAVELLTSLEKRSSRSLPAVYYALSKAHQKHYRFESALKSIGEGFAIVKSDVEITEYTIPGSEEILKESTRDGLSVSLAMMEKECSTWHPPDATCRAIKCVNTSRWYGPDRKIYFSDPAFNGMVVLICSNRRFRCKIKFHQVCWKQRKDKLSVVKKLSDKDIFGQECFTPNCESVQGESSVITKVEIYGDDGKLKTTIDAPANPVVRPKRRPVPKGAIPKQPVKPVTKRPREKPLRPIVVSTPRTNCKESKKEDGLKKLEALTKLAKLRKNNFGFKPDYEWRPDLAMYGNSQMTKVVDFLGGPVLENDSKRVAAMKTFVFTYFYEYIKENGCVSKKDISQKWEEDKYSICDNYNQALRNYTGICEFLLQSYKLVSIGDYMSIAENLPELYSLVRSEVCGCLRFLLADLIRPSTIPLRQKAPSSQKTSSEATKTHSKKGNGTVVKSQNPPSKTVAVKQKSNNNYVKLKEIVAFPLVSENSAGPNNGSLPTSIPENGEEGSSEAGAAPIESENQSQIMETELIHSEVQVSCQESDVRLPVDENIEPISDPADLESSPRDSGEVEPDIEKIPVAEICTASVKVEKNETDTVVLQATQSTETEKNVDVEKSDEPLGVEEKPKVSKSDTDMATMISEICAQLIQKEIVSQKIASQADKNELEENLKILEERCAKLEIEREEIALKLENCERELRQSSQENDLLKSEKTELISNYEKLNVEKTTLQLNFIARQNEISVLKIKTSSMESRMLKLQEEKEKMLIKLKEYQIFIDEQTTRESLQKETTQFEQELSEDVTKSSARKAKIESLEREYFLNNKLLEKTVDKCHDHIRMYNEVEKLLTVLTGQQFAMAGALEPWKGLAFFLRQTMMRIEEDYLKFRTRLESNEPIENLEEFKLQIPSIAFPQLPPLVDIYYRNAQANLMMQQMQRGMVPGARHVNPFSVPPPARPYFPTPGFPPGAHDPLNSRYGTPFPRDPRADVMNKAQPEQMSPRNDIHKNGERKNENAEYHDQRKQNPVLEVMGSPRPPVVPNDKDNRQDKIERNDPRPHSSGIDPFDGASQMPIERKSNPSKKSGTDSLVKKLRLKYEGVPEIDLLESVEDLRKMHNDSLTGMRVEDIIRETEPLVKMRQERHMARYLPPPAQTSQPQNRSIPLPRSKNNQRKIPPLMPQGVRKPQRGSTAENFDFKGNHCNFDLPGSSSFTSLPSASKKPAWAPVSSGLPDWKKSEEDTECTICYDGMNAFGDRNPPYTLPCKHSYHTGCIKKWLAETSVCPICRIHCTMDTEFPPLP